jgi:hypothetical protein
MGFSRKKKNRRRFLQINKSYPIDKIMYLSYQLLNVDMYLSIITIIIRQSAAFVNEEENRNTYIIEQVINTNQTC